MNILAFDRTAYTAPTTDNALVDKSGCVNFERAAETSFAFSRTVPSEVDAPFRPAAHYNLARLGKSCRQRVIQTAVRGALAALEVRPIDPHTLITGVSVTVDNDNLEVWTRFNTSILGFGCYPSENENIRDSIETSIAVGETPEPPKGFFRKLLYDEDAARARMAHDRTRPTAHGDGVPDEVLSKMLKKARDQ